MIVWLASYPRSGNTFVRIVLHRVFGVPTYSVYDDDDPVAQRIGPELVGYRPKPADRGLMASGPDLYFVKTHKRRKKDRQPAIYLVRDGRDSVVSKARLLSSSQPAADKRDLLYRQRLREEIVRPYLDGQPSSGTWGCNVLSWLDNGDVPLAVLRYEDLIVDPRDAVQHAVASLALALVPFPDSQIPSFSGLHAIDPQFFAHGQWGSYRHEMPDDLHELFWEQPENAAAMRTLGYEK